ncbi:MAG: DUF309 domain-containing protein [Deinococcus sp.]
MRPDHSRLREELRLGAGLFNAGQWWEAHEAWEEVWQRSRGDQRRLVQGLILLAAALHKRWHHGSLAHRNYFKAAALLDPLPPRCAGLDLRRLRAEVWRALHGQPQGAPGPPQLPLE